MSATVTLREHERPIIPQVIRNRATRRAAARNRRRNAAFHGVRTPMYAKRLACAAPRGVAKLSRSVHRFVTQPNHRAAVDELRGMPAWVDADQAWRKRARDRALFSFSGALMAVGGQWHYGPDLGPWTITGGVLAAGLALGAYGWPQDRALIVPTAEVPADSQILTVAVIREALAGLGIARLTNNIDTVHPVDEPHRDGPGWACRLDLPVPAEAVEAKRLELAANLNRGLGAVIVKTDRAKANRLFLWAGDEDISAAKLPQWPCLKAERLSVFDRFPVGVSVQGETIDMSLMYSNLLVGALPGAGKTTFVRLVAAAMMLDPRTRLWLYDFKGAGDFDVLEPIAEKFMSSPRKEDAAVVLDSLRSLWAEYERRADRLKELGAVTGTAGRKVTEEIADIEDMRPLVVIIDEAQQLYEHKTFGDEAGELASEIVRLGRAVGIILITATQRPSAGSIPRDLTTNVGTRMCFAVMDYRASNMVLGDGMSTRGINAAGFNPTLDCGTGILVGQHAEPQTMRVFNPSEADFEAIVSRALALRGGGVAKHEPEPEPRSIVDDIVSVAKVGETELWSQTICERLAMHPDYKNIKPLTLARMLKPFGHTPKDVWLWDDAKGEKVNRKGYSIEAMAW